MHQTQMRKVLMRALTVRLTGGNAQLEMTRGECDDREPPLSRSTPRLDEINSILYRRVRNLLDQNRESDCPLHNLAAIATPLDASISLRGVLSRTSFTGRAFAASRTSQTRLLMLGSVLFSARTCAMTSLASPSIVGLSNRTRSDNLTP